MLDNLDHCFPKQKPLRACADFLKGENTVTGGRSQTHPEVMRRNRYPQNSKQPNSRDGVLTALRPPKQVGLRPPWKYGVGLGDIMFWGGLRPTYFGGLGEPPVNNPSRLLGSSECSAQTCKDQNVNCCACASHLPFPPFPQTPPDSQKSQ